MDVAVDAGYREAPAHLAAYEHPVRTKKRVTTGNVGRVMREPSYVRVCR